MGHRSNVCDLTTHFSHKSLSCSLSVLCSFVWQTRYFGKRGGESEFAGRQCSSSPRNLRFSNLLSPLGGKRMERTAIRQCGDKQFRARRIKNIFTAGLSQPECHY